MTTANTSRRAVLAGAAAIPMLGLPIVNLSAIASKDDRLNIAIEAYRHAENALNKIVDEKGKYEAGAFARGERPDDRFDNAEDECSNTALDAMWNVISIVPASAAGLAVLMRFVRENPQVKEHLQSDERYMAMFHTSIEDFVCDLAGLPVPETDSELLDAA